MTFNIDRFHIFLPQRFTYSSKQQSTAVLISAILQLRILFVRWVTQPPVACNISSSNSFRVGIESLDDIFFMKNKYFIVKNNEKYRKIHFFKLNSFHIK